MRKSLSPTCMDLVKYMILRKTVSSARVSHITVSLQKRLSEMREAGFIIGKRMIKATEKTKRHYDYWIIKVPKWFK